MTHPSRTLNFFEKLASGLQESKLAYICYQENGKTFSLAQKIREKNQLVSSLLADNIDVLSPSLKMDAAELLYHYKIWTEKWDDLKEQVDPKANDEFIFANAFTFPRPAANRLMEEYEHLKTES